MDNVEFIDVVNELNQELFDEHEETIHSFSYLTNTYAEVILFDDILLWGSETDDREFNEDENDYEPIGPFIKRKFNEYVEELYSLRFKNNAD